MNKQPNWAQAAYAQEQGSSKSKMPFIVAGVVILVALIALVAVLSTNDSKADPKVDQSSLINFAAVNVSGDPLPEQPDGSGLLDTASDPAVGKTVPTLVGTTMEKKPITIGPGKPTVAMFVAHWCPHCQKEVPLVSQWDAAGTIPDSVDYVAVSTSANEEESNFPPSKWLVDEGFKRSVMVDSGNNDAATAWGLKGFPYFVAYDASGKVVQRASGELTEDQFKQLLASVTP